MSLLFIFSNDDAGSGEVERFRELLKFLRDQDVRATFFTVPTPRSKPIPEEWTHALGSAIDDGHELEMHGLNHSAPAGCEFGITPDFVLDIMKDGKKIVQERREEIEKELTVEKITQKLEKGVVIFKRTLNMVPRGFRSPCTAVHKNMFIALEKTGFHFDSSLVVNTAGWRFISKYQGLKYLDQDYTDILGWEKAIPTKPYVHESGIVEVPIISEYTWFLSEKDVERQIDMALNDLNRVYEAKGIFVALSHFYAMTGEYSAGLKVYKKLFSNARKKGAEFVTMREAVRRIPL